MLHNVLRVFPEISESRNDRHWCLHYLQLLHQRLPITAGIIDNATKVIPCAKLQPQWIMDTIVPLFLEATLENTQLSV